MKIVSWLMPLLVAAPVLADTTLEYAGSGQAPRIIAVAGGKVMMSADAQNDVLYDASSRTLTMVNHANKTYTRMDEARMKQLAAVAKNAMQNIDALMANLPAEQRAQLQGMMPSGGSGIPQVSVQNTGRKDTVNGKSCEVWETRMNNAVESEMCVAGQDAVSVSGADMATLRQLFQATSQIAAQAGMSDAGAEWQALDGKIPLRIVEMAGGQRHVYTLKQASSDKVPASRFAVPNGYREQAMALPGASGGGF